MEERKTPPPRIASRTAVMAAVAVLIVIAIAGIVLASMRGRTASPEGTGPQSTQAGASAPTGTSASGQSAGVADEGGPNEVFFAPGSDQLSPAATAKLTLLASTAKKEGRSVVVATKIEANADRVKNMEMAKKRAYNVRGVLTTGGVSLSVMKIEVSELPVGLVPPSIANRVEVALR
jgi:outer membrane protein OmpA-like peptidoglycan-associated protein